MQTPKEILLEDIKQLEHDKNILLKALNIKKKQVAEINCPFIIGDILENNKGEKAVLVSISPFFTDSYQIEVSKLNKNGHPSKLVINGYCFNKLADL